MDTCAGVEFGDTASFNNPNFPNSSKEMNCSAPKWRLNIDVILQHFYNKQR